MRRVKLSGQSAKFLKQANKGEAARLAQAIEKLRADARPPQSKKLLGNRAGLRRLRVGDYRIVYFIDAENTLRIAAIGQRRDIYR